MNRSDIAKMVANARSDAIKAAAGGISDQDAEQLVTTIVVGFLEAIALTLQCEEPVVLYGFGKFEVRHLDARTMVNPASGALVEIPERATASFVPSRALKDRLST